MLLVFSLQEGLKWKKLLLPYFLNYNTSPIFQELNLEGKGAYSMLENKTWPEVIS